MSKSEDPLDEPMTVAKTATCDTLTRKSKLTYQIGTLPDGEVYVRVHKNSGNGFFSNEWVALADIQKTIGKVPAGKPVTAIVLSDLFTGKSVNTPGFLLAVLLQEKLLMPMKGKKRSHERVDPEEFMGKVERLTSADVKPKTAARKTARKTSAASTKKTAIKKRSIAKKKSATASTKKTSTAQR